MSTVSVLAGKTFFFLGSSVTYGYASGGVAMAELLAEKHGCSCIKEAVSGTTLANLARPGAGPGYAARLEAAMRAENAPARLDAFVLQLSTNDMRFPENLGYLLPDDVKDAEAFDRSTTFGAMEWIIASVRERWHCPLLCYTNPWLENPYYAAMVEGARHIAAKWGIALLDLYGDEAFCNITAEQRKRWMQDPVHPTLEGYREWWLPRFEESLVRLTGDGEWKTQDGKACGGYPAMV